MIDTAQAPTSVDDLFAGPGRPSGHRPVVRVGVIGAADAATPHLRALAGSVPGARVVAVQDDGDRRRVAELADFAGASVCRHPDQVVGHPDVDAVVIAGGTDLDVLCGCVEAGVPAYLEPGRVREPDDVRALVSLEVALGRRLSQVGFVRRHDPAHLALRRAVTDGVVGGARLVRTTDRGARPGRTGGGWPATLLHALDGVGWLIGDQPARIRVELADAGGPLLLSTWTGHGSRALLEVHDGAAWGHDVRCEVVGEAGGAELAAVPPVRLRTAGTISGPTDGDAVARFADALRIGLTAWVRSLHSGRPMGASAWDWHVATTAAAAAASSLVTGDAVDVDPGPRPGLYDAVPHRVGAQAPLVPRSSPVSGPVSAAE